MIRVHLVRRISPDKVQDGELTSGMLGCPSCEIEDLIVVDDEVVSCDDALLELCARDDGVTRGDLGVRHAVKQEAGSRK